jgi:acetoin utilization deacetylase AcuC-like enzyme
LIVQCGVDGLAGDPYAMWNWDVDAEREGTVGWCVQRVMKWVATGTGLKVVFLGGGEHVHRRKEHALTGRRRRIQQPQRC